MVKITGVHFICMCTHTSHTDTHINIDTYIHIYTYMHAHTYIYTYIHTYTHTHTNIHDVGFPTVCCEYH